MPGIIPGAGDTAVNRAAGNSCLRKRADPTKLQDLYRGGSASLLEVNTCRANVPFDSVASVSRTMLPIHIMF